MAYAKRKKKKLSPKEVRRQVDQPQEVMSALDRGVNVVVAHWKPIGGVVLGMAVVLGSISIYQSAHAAKENEAAGLLYDAEMELPDPGGYGFASTLDDEDESAEKLSAAIEAFDEVIAEYGGTVQADIANLEAGHALLQRGDGEAAAERYALAADSRSDMVAALALASQATALETLERYDEEIEVLRELIERASGATREYAYIDLVRAYRLGGNDEGALAACREFEETLPDSPLITDIQGIIRELGGEPAAIETTPDEETGAEGVTP